MSFNSPEFAAFLIVVLLLCYVSPHRLQNRILLLASYFFYGYWDWRFLSLIILSTVVDFLIAIGIEDTSSGKVRKCLLGLSIAINLGILGFFKYFNFFAESTESLLAVFGLEVSVQILDVVLPVGISFYTFQTMSYTVDVYRQELKPLRNVLDFALYVAFFPQLVAGPIERAVRLVPQILTPRTLSMQMFARGSYLVLFGLVKKVAIADGVASSIGPVFANPGFYGRWDVMVATYLFAIEIYCDFSGYTDIARGVSKMIGFDLMLNFNLPYVSWNPQEFWRRWHISLSTWLRDYLYIPLGGNRASRFRENCNLMITMVLGGLWHGAATNFILWGIYQGTILIVYRTFCRNARPPTGINRMMWTILFFQITCFGWLLFRADSIASIGTMLKLLFVSPFDVQVLINAPKVSAILGLPILFVIEGIHFYFDDPKWYLRLPPMLRGSVYAVLFVALLSGFRNPSAEFIYFQF